MPCAPDPSGWLRSTALGGCTFCQRHQDSWLDASQRQGSIHQGDDLLLMPVAVAERELAHAAFEEFRRLSLIHI